MRTSPAQNTKLDEDVVGEPFLSNGKFTAYLTDDDQVNFKCGRILWQDDRFRNCPGRLGHAQYESMCNSLRDTSQWKASRPEEKFAPGYAAYTKRTPEQMASDQACCVSYFSCHNSIMQGATAVVSAL